MRVWCLCLFVIAGSIACTAPRQAHTGELRSISFRMIGAIPVVEGRLNGRQAFFIIDTGASVSVLNESEAGYFRFNVVSPLYSVNSTAIGFGGHSDLKDATGYDLEIGGMRVCNISFKTRNMADFASVVMQYENLPVSGIIGSDVFKRYGIIINYRERTLTFGNR